MFGTFVIRRVVFETFKLSLQLEFSLTSCLNLCSVGSQLRLLLLGVLLGCLLAGLLLLFLDFSKSDLLLQCFEATFSGFSLLLNVVLLTLRFAPVKYCQLSHDEGLICLLQALALRFGSFLFSANFLGGFFFSLCSSR